MQSIRTGSKQLIREINQAIVLNAVRMRRAVSRTEIAKQTGLGLPTVSGITAELVDAGLLVERESDATAPGSSATASSALGRRPVLLSLNAAAGYAIGAKITERQVVAVLTDLDANVVARHDLSLKRRDIDAVVDAIGQCADALTPSADGRPIHGAGVGLAGVIDRDRGEVRHATYSDWESVPLASLLSERLGRPVVVDNDVNALVAAEQWFGAGRGIADFVTVSVGRGIGLGLVLDGRLYRGAHGGAGEFGHIKVMADGPACPCGSRGCLEALASEPAIAAAVSAAKGTKLTITKVLALAASGDDDALRAYADAGRLLGTAIGNLLNVLNPRVVVLAGEGTRGCPFQLAAMREAMEAAAFDGIADDLELVVEPWDDEAWARGAASLLLGELFQPALRPGEDSRPSLTARQ
ncbi:ROK family transcriptional regulator [Desertimonas flava]|uniref:ROK family transcriptional regulator n=1 Tax=Desertimonas flava TaxID=2064846 RepID=UPI000E342343|nr:ROK family transcriptional regulator [Desertimonas flava]